MAPSVVVPNGDHCVPAELLDRRGVVGVLRHQVQIRLHAHVQQHLHRVLVHAAQLGYVLRPHDLLDRPYAVHAPLQVVRVAEVVEGDGGAAVHVGVEEAQFTGGERAVDLFQYEAPTECLPGQVLLVSGVLLRRLQASLRRWDGGELPNLWQFLQEAVRTQGIDQLG